MNVLDNVPTEPTIHDPVVIQSQLALLAQIILDLDIPGYWNALEHADAIGPFVDPTLWMRKHEDYHRGKELAEGALAFYKAALSLRMKALEQLRKAQ